MLGIPVAIAAIAAIHSGVSSLGRREYMAALKKSDPHKYLSEVYIHQSMDDYVSETTAMLCQTDPLDCIRTLHDNLPKSRYLQAVHQMGEKGEKLENLRQAQARESELQSLMEKTRTAKRELSGDQQVALYQRLAELVPENAEYKKTAVEIELQSILEKVHADDGHVSIDEKLTLYRKLSELAPDVTDYKKEVARLQQQVVDRDKKAAAEEAAREKKETAEAAARQRKEAAEEAAREKKEAAEKKRRGVTLGMTQEDVLASSWGKPKHRNKTTFTFGVHEQWCYGEYGGSCLYFEDGILTTIQN